MKAQFYDNLDRNKLKCKLCPHNCEILPSKSGFCGVRKNENGQFMLQEHIAALTIRTAEQVPFFHFLPGAKTLHITFNGDNFSHGHTHDHIDLQLKTHATQEIIDKAFQNQVGLIVFDGAEATTAIEKIAEIILAVKEAEPNIKFALSTNVYIEKNALEQLLLYIEAVHVKILSFSETKMREQYKALLDPILRNTILLKKKRGIHLEVSIHDDEDLQLKDFIIWAEENLGEKVPVHILTEEAPFVSTSLPYLYASNQNTFCPKCEKEVIIRKENILQDNFTKSGKCRCGKQIY